MGTTIAVAAPPELPQSAPSTLLARLLPVAVSLIAACVMAAAIFAGPPAHRSPTLLAFPLTMLASVVLTAVTARGRGRGIDADRTEYLAYLSGMRATVAEAAAAQRSALLWAHPDPDALWTLIGGPRMFERGPADPAFCHVRVGVGAVALHPRLAAPEPRPAGRSDPVTAAALDRFLSTHSTVPATPEVISLNGRVAVGGDAARELVNAMACQLAVLHAPEHLLIAGVVGESVLAHWDWLKWLPHNRHPTHVDAAGPARMVYETWSQAQRALADAAACRVVTIVDTDEPLPVGAVGDVITIEVGGGPLTITHPGGPARPDLPDRLDDLDAVTCARRLAAHGASSGAARGWPELAGVGDVSRFDPAASWRSQPRADRLRVPIGIAEDGGKLDLDIREPALGGIGPHGLCVGATGSGKSELLRTVALGMMALNSPAVLNLLLIDFKGGATFLDMAQAPHVGAVITNLADEAHLVARMREALAGEISRRQLVLRAAGNAVSVGAYEDARRADPRLPALPTLFIIVDEFSELLTQHPEFAETFVAIGRLGRSLGMHLLLASQRLDEGRLRGLEAHLSYRICLKTLSASESRTAIGTADAFELPGTPGAGFLRSAAGEPIRFEAALVSAPTRVAAAVQPAGVRPFTSRNSELLIHQDETPAPSVLRLVLDRLSGLGPQAHPVWLPPLGPPPSLGVLLREGGIPPARLCVPIGLTDRPFEQCRTPLTVELTGAAGHVAVVGAPRSGKSTALRTLIAALAATHDAGAAQFYCLDFGGGSLAGVRELPHVGTVAGRAEPATVRRMIAELESTLRTRESLPGERRGDLADVFLVVDGWEGLRQEFETLEAPITVLAGRGLSFGIHVILSASRWAEIRPSLRDQIGTRIELRLGDPADSEVDRGSARQVPADRPGRGLSSDGLHMVIARPDGADVRHGDVVAPPIPMLPDRVDYDVLADRTGRVAGTLLGLSEHQLRPLAVDFGRRPHLLVVGDNECGKTGVLRTLCRDLIRTRGVGRAELLVVDFRRTLCEIAESEHTGWYAMSPAALDAQLPTLLDLLRRRMPPPDASRAVLRARSWWSGPDIYVVVDDYDLVATAAGNPLAPLLEYLPHATDLGLHLMVARRSGGAARAFFEPLLAGLRDFGCAELKMTGHPDLGPGALPPGRGVLVTRPGDEHVVQVAWSPPQ
jgi:DNA segregation ATPase FtsK/SpoIIIE, S-DNA-T family